MACRRVDANTERMLTYGQLGPYEKVSVKFSLKRNTAC